jgi:hypothetical protein
MTELQAANLTQPRKKAKKCRTRLHKVDPAVFVFGNAACTQMETLLYIDYRRISTVSWHMCLYCMLPEHEQWVRTYTLCRWDFTWGSRLCKWRRLLSRQRWRALQHRAIKVSQWGRKRASVERGHFWDPRSAVWGRYTVLFDAFWLDSERAGRIRRIRTLRQATRGSSSQWDGLSTLGFCGKHPLQHRVGLVPAWSAGCSV